MAETPKLIGEFLSELAENSLLLEAYLKNPEKALARSGLTEEQQQTLRSTNLAEIRDAIREEYARADILLFAFAVQHITAPQIVADDED
jgi:hypothetical protein